MLIRLSVVLACALTVPVPVPAQLGSVKPTPTSRSIAGTWYSSRGLVTFELGGAGYLGTVTTPTAGRIRLSGFFVAGVFNGNWWVEDHSGQRCSTAIYEGQHNWGRFRLAFEGGSFTGRYTTCDAPMESGEAWGGSNGVDVRPSGPQWIFRDATLQVPGAEALGPGCRLEKADGNEASLAFEIRCPGPSGREQKTTGRLSFDIKRPKGWVPGLTFRSSARLQIAGVAGAGATASCHIGLQGLDGTPLFPPLTAAAGKDARGNGEASVPGPPACGPGDVCPTMSIVCSMAAPQPVVMTRLYTWER